MCKSGQENLNSSPNSYSTTKYFYTIHSEVYIHIQEIDKSAVGSGLEELVTPWQ